MASAKLEGTMSTEELQGKLVKTKQFTHTNEMNTYLTNCIKTAGDNISMPTNGFFAELSPSYRQEMLNLYNGTFGLFDEVNAIPDEVKISQAALLDSLHYGYVVAEEKVELYTMNPGIFIPDMSVLPEKVLSSIIEKNKVGLLKCYRVDLEYNQKNETAVNYKLVNHRRDVDDDGNVYLIPYLAGIRMILLIQSFLSKGFILKTKQEVAGGEKVRCITLKQDILQKYCDEASAVEGLEAKYYPLKAFFYAPVVGAPSTTAMVTNVNLFRLCELKRVTKVSQMTEMGVQKPKDPIDSMLRESAITATLMGIKENNPDEFMRVIEKLPKRNEILGDVLTDDITARHISMYLHTVKNADVQKVLKLLPTATAIIENRKQVFTSCRKATPEELKDIRGLLKNHICRFIVQKKDFTLSSMTGTNSTSILQKIYGSDYFNKYESIGVRFNAAANYVEESGSSFESAMKRFGLDETSGVDLKAVSVEATNEVADNPDIKEEDAYRNALFFVLGKRQRKSSSGGSIMMRTVDAYIVGDDVEGYYKNVDPEKIKSVFVLS